MNYSSRFFLYAPLGLFIALALGVMIHWWRVADAFDQKLKTLRGHDAIPGIAFSYDTVTISGFPFRLDAVFTNFRLTGAGPHGPFAWKTENFALHALTYGRAQDIFEAAGRQSIDWTDAQNNPHRLTFLPGSLRASTIADARGLARFDLDIIAAGGEDGGGAKFTFGGAQFHMRRDPLNDTLDLMATITSVNAFAPPPPFGHQINDLEFYESLSHGRDFRPLLNGTESWPDTAEGWKQAGGMAVPAARRIAATTREAPRPLSAAESDAVAAILRALY